VVSMYHSVLAMSYAGSVFQSLTSMCLTDSDYAPLAAYRGTRFELSSCPSHSNVSQSWKNTVKIGSAVRSAFDSLFKFTLPRRCRQMCRLLA
jgi:hypothetical protein